MGNFVDDLPPEPNRGQPEDDYVATAQRWAAALPRFGRQMDSLGTHFNMAAGVLQLGYLKPVSYVAGIRLTIATQTVEHEGVMYAPLLGVLPFTTSGVFEEGHFRVIQGVTSSDLSTPDASSRVGFLPAGSGAVPTDVETKLRERVSICDRGGLPDGASSNTAAITSLHNDGFRRIRFPAGGANVYVLDGALVSSVTRGMEWDVDAGVTISVLDPAYLDTSLRVTRPTRLWLSAFNREYWLTPSRGYEPACRPTIMAQSEVDHSVIEPIRPNAGDLTYRDVAWPAGDVFGSFVPAATSVSGVQLDLVADSKFKMCFRDTLPGEQLTIQFAGLQNGDVLIAAAVRTVRGYHGIYCGTSIGAVPDYFDKYAGQAAVVTPVEMDFGGHASYAGYLSLWTIRVNSPNTFSILFNGVAVVENRHVDGEIIDAGFGAYRVSGTPSIVLGDWTVRKFSRQAGLAPCRLAIFGDSRVAANMPDTWPNWLRAYLDGFNGMRVHQIDNFAVPGASIAEQALLCTPANIANADVVIIDIGANNVQSGTQEDDYAAKLRVMHGVADALDIPVIMGIPDLYYGQQQAGVGVGQATTNYQLGKGIRAKCLRVAADVGAQVVDKMQVLGKITSQYINPATPGSVASLNLEPRVYDSIHWTAAGQQLIAAEYSRKIVGIKMSRPSVSMRPTLLPATNLANGWKFETRPARIVRDVSGIARLIGLIDIGSVVADSTIIYTLPENWHATQSGIYVCAAGGGGKTVTVAIDAFTGQMSIYGFPVGAATWVSLDGISFPTRMMQ